MAETLSKEQKQTQETFKFKWQKRDTYESEAVQTEWRRWLMEKYFDNDHARLEELFSGGKKKVLDAGCGAGGSGLLLFESFLDKHDYTGIDISDSVEVARQRFLEKSITASFLKSPLESIPDELGLFDIIFSEGVLHHTDCVENAICKLATHLKPGGSFMFYVYRKKAPVREFTDDLIREHLSSMSDEDAWNALEPLTKLGQILGDLDIEIDVPQDIPYLGIKAGKQNLQRLFFYKICKMYYRPEYTIDEMNHINFDWFRPTNCHRHTPEEINSYCQKADLEVQRCFLDESGITIIASKRLNQG